MPIAFQWASQNNKHTLEQKHRPWIHCHLCPCLRTDHHDATSIIRTTNNPRRTTVKTMAASTAAHTSNITCWVVLTTNPTSGLVLNTTNVKNHARRIPTSNHHDVNNTVAARWTNFPTPTNPHHHVKGNNKNIHIHIHNNSTINTNTNIIHGIIKPTTTSHLGTVHAAIVATATVIIVTKYLRGTPTITVFQNLVWKRFGHKKPRIFNPTMMQTTRARYRPVSSVNLVVLDIYLRFVNPIQLVLVAVVTTVGTTITITTNLIITMEVININRVVSTMAAIGNTKVRTKVKSVTLALEQTIK